MIWIIGEYAERIDNADELLESFVEGFHDENTQVRVNDFNFPDSFILLCLLVRINLKMKDLLRRISISRFELKSFLFLHSFF